MPLTKEQLLIPRYLCTGTPGKSLWYGCHWKHGDIIQMENTVLGLCCVYDDGKGTTFKGQPFFDGYPHLFKPLPWWYGRKPEEMPEFVRIKDKGVFKVDVWDFVHEEAMIFNGDLISTVSIEILTPATEEEYAEYKKQKEG